MAQRVVFSTYAFIFGIAIAMAASATIDQVWPAYAAAALCGIIGWGMAVAQERGRAGIHGGLVYLLIGASAIALGYGRYAQKTYIAPFDPSARAQHIKTLIEQFPDLDRKKDHTRMLGRIVAEPEFRPVEDRPGVVVLTIEPFMIEPDPESGQTYEVSGGNVMVYLRPSAWTDRDKPFREIFEKLAFPDGYGYVVEVDAQFTGFKPADNPGLFDPELFYHDHEVFATASIPFWDPLKPPIAIREESEGNPIVELSLEIKKRMLGIMKITIPFPESAFLAGVTLGTDRGLDGIRCIFEEAPPAAPEGSSADAPIDLRQFILDEFRWSGTTHILSVSGLHVTIIAGALWALFVILRIPKKIYTVIIIGCLIIFCFITGAEPPTTRAVIMNSLVLITYVYLGASLRASLLMAIGVAAAAILLNNPKWLIEPSFALSFMAMLSLGLLTPPSEELVKKIPGANRLPGWLQAFLGAQVAIQLGMMGPLSAYYFCRASVAGPFANFLAIPLSDIIIQLGLFASLIGMIPVVGIYVALTLNAANYLLIWFFLWATHITTIFFPYPFIQTMTPRMLAAYYALLALFIWNKPLLRHGRILYYDLVMGVGGARRKHFAIGTFATAFCLILAVSVWGFAPRTPTGDLHVNVLAVRYGSAIHIETPGGAQILVDAGPNDFRSGWNTGERTIAQYLLKDRIGQLDALIMTSPSPEDIGGISAILKIFPVKRFYAALPFWKWNLDSPEEFLQQAGAALQNDVAQGRRNSDFEDAVFLLSEASIAMRGATGLRRLFEIALISPTSVFSSTGPPECFEVTGGMVLWTEDGPHGRFRIVALHPNPDFPLKPSNNNSIVLRIEYGSTAFLLTSDITADGVRELLRVQPELLRADVITVPAHGSSKANIPYLYETVKPDTAVISYGYARDLRPPPGRGRSRETYRDSLLDHRQLFMRDIEGGTNQTEMSLQDAGIEVVRTDANGAIRFRSDGERVFMEMMYGAPRAARAGEGGDAVEEATKAREVM
ncbi:MAG: ComEC/Rec2 family competence protein [Candidatus Hydrogenedentota bacterium]